MTAGLERRPYGHMSGLTVTKAPPLERHNKTCHSAQTSQHPTVLPIEQGSHCRGAQVPDEQACHRAQVSTGPGVASVANSPKVLSPITTTPQTLNKRTDAGPLLVIRYCR